MYVSLSFTNKQTCKQSKALKLCCAFLRFVSFINLQPGKGYPEGQMTAPLLEIFKKYGLADEWQHYRLKGSQTNWTDPTDLPTLPGNSILERGFVSTSSCINCHAYASFDSGGLQ